MNVPVHVSTVPAGINPAGLWVRVCTWDLLLDEHAIGRAGVVEHGDIQGAIMKARRQVEGEKVWTYVYDGDTGECIATLIDEPKGDQT